MGEELPLHESINEEDWNLTEEKFQSILNSPTQTSTATAPISPLLEEAIKYYRWRIPPFVVQRPSQTGARKASVPDKTILLVENYCLDDNKSRKRTILFRKWIDKYGFWTLDLNGKRCIIKAMSGGALGGVHYEEWLGCSYGFGSDTIAHCVFKGPIRGPIRRSSRSKKVIRDDFDGRNPSPSQETPGAEEHSNGTPRAQRKAKTRAEEKIKATTNWLLNPSITSLYYKEEIHGGDRLNARSRHSRSGAPADESPRKSLRKNPNPIDTEPQPSLNDKRTDRKSQSFASANRRRVFFSTPQPTRAAPGSKRTYDTFSAMGHEDIATALKRRREAVRQSLPSQLTGETDLAMEPNYVTARSLGGNLASLERDSNELDTLSNADSDAGDSPPGSAYPKTITPDEFAEEPTQVGGASSPEILPQPTTTAEDNEPNSLHLLSSTKLSNTFLLITIPPNPDFKIAKLSACATVDDVKTAILQPFKLDKEIDQVDSFRFKFEWLPANAFYRTLLIEPDQMSSSFDYVVKRIDKAELWATEGESCYLGVDIVLKNGA